MQLIARYSAATMFLISLAILLSACGNGKDTQVARVPAGPQEILLGAKSLTLEENRQTIVLRNGVQRYEHVEKVTVQIRDLAQADQPVVWQGEATRYHDQDGSYWVVYPAFTHAGPWLFDVTVTPASDHPITQSLVAEVLEAPEGLTPGMVAVPSETFVWNGPNQPERITTDLTPNEAFYRMTVAQAVTSGKPSVLLFATPGLCTRKLCGSVVDSLDPVWQVYQDRVNFVHVEVYNLDTGKFVPAMAEWGLTEKPWIYLVDASGIIVTRYDALIGSDEISPVIEAILMPHVRIIG